jgi:hypothetical protein
MPASSMEVSMYGLTLTLVLGTFSGLFGSGCSNEIKNEIVSPDGKLKAVFFQRDCGATTAASTQVALIDEDDKLPNDSGNVFVATGNGDVHVEWTSAHGLTVHYPLDMEVYSSVTVVHGVQVTFGR